MSTAARKSSTCPTTPTDADIQAAVDDFAVSAPDDKTFVVKMDHPTGYFLDLATLWGTAPYQEKWITSPNATEAGNYVSSGPFQLKSWDHQAEIVLEPNPNWYGDVKPTLTEIRYHIGGDPAAAQAAFEAGEYDSHKAPPDEVPRIMDDPELGPLTPGRSLGRLRLLGLLDGQGSHHQPGVASRAGHGDRQGHAARDRLRRPGHRRRQPDPARYPGSPARHRPSVRRRGRQGRTRDRLSRSSG